MARPPESSIRSLSSRGRVSPWVWVVAMLFREAILAKEDALVALTVQQSLLAVRTAMSLYGKQLAERVQRGMKVAFATSIAHMLERALWIVGLAVAIVLFIPEVPLRS